MRLTLTIENFSKRPDGGPLTYVAEGRRSVDIGRNQHLDFCLPDENHFISGRHCEIGPKDGAYYLTDVSTNGTFVNSWDRRVQSPYRLRDGDRLFIGDYIVVVRVEDDPEAPQEARDAAGAPPPPSYDDFWRSAGSAPPPIDPRSLDPRRLDPTPHVDWIDHAAEIATPVAPTPGGRSPTASASVWGSAPPRPAPPSPPFAPSEPTGNPWAMPPSPPPLAAADPWAALSAEPPRAAAPVAAPIPAAPPPQPFAGPPPPPAPAKPEAPTSAADVAYAEFLSGLSRALGLPEQALAGASPGQLGERLGALTRLIAEETRQLLKARTDAKRQTRSASHTIVEAQGNNPLKFAPTTEEALRILLGAPQPGYLDAQPAFGQAFGDVKRHQLCTYVAMQDAVRMLGAGLSPAAIESGLTGDTGLAAVLTSRKARLWDRYVERWGAMSTRSDDKLADAFMRNFAECYDRADAQK
jgi:type VI secretion system protein ImpI